VSAAPGAFSGPESPLPTDLGAWLDACPVALDDETRGAIWEAIRSAV
jgi:hypothetical protein